VYTALFIQYEKRMRRIMLSSVAYLAIPNFSTLSHNGTTSGEKSYWIQNVFFFSTTFIQNISHSNSASYYHICTQVFMQSTRYTRQVFITVEFSRQVFEKTLKYQISWKSFQLEPSYSMRTDGRTGMTKLLVGFRNFANASKKPHDLPLRDLQKPPYSSPYKTLNPTLLRS
jgi:hypothetical protein